MPTRSPAPPFVSYIQALFSQRIPTLNIFPPKEWVGVEVSNIEGKSFREIFARGNFGVEQMLPIIPVDLLPVVRGLAASNIMSSISFMN